MNTIQNYIHEKTRNKNNIEDSLRILFIHLFKYFYNPTSQSGSWIGSCIENYNQIVKIAIHGSNKIVTPKTKFNIDFISIISDKTKMNKILNDSINDVIYENPQLKNTNFSFNAFYGYFNNYEELCDSVKMYRFLIDYAKDDSIKLLVTSKYDKNNLKKSYTRQDMNEFNYTKQQYF